MFYSVKGFRCVFTDKEVEGPQHHEPCGHLLVATQDPGAPPRSPVFCLRTVIQEGEL